MCHFTGLDVLQINATFIGPFVAVVKQVKVVVQVLDIREFTQPGKIRICIHNEFLMLQPGRFYRDPELHSFRDACGGQQDFIYDVSVVWRFFDSSYAQPDKPPKTKEQNQKASKNSDCLVAIKLHD